MKWITLMIFCIISIGKCAVLVTPTTTFTDVQNTIFTSRNGDTVIVTNGSSTWTGNMVITQGIIFNGSGSNITIITDGRTTVSSALLDITNPANATNQLNGFEWREGGTHDGPGTDFNGMIRIHSSNADLRRIRVSSNYFNNLNSVSVFFHDCVGVADHNTFTNASQIISCYVFHKNWNGGGPYADGSRADSPHWGTDQFMFFEDNLFLIPPTASPSGAYAPIDAYGGARYCFRHNKTVNGWVEAHGLDSGGREGGCRAVEAYNNNFLGDDTTDYVVNLRSGGLLFHDNTVSGHQSNPQVHLDAYRRFYSFPIFLQADGTNSWDENLGVVGDSGTITANGTLTVTDNTKSWIPGQWNGWQINKLTGANLIHSSSITTNTATVITYHDDGGYSFIAGTLTWTNGNAYTITYVTNAIDQPGRGGGTELDHSATPTVPVGWNNQTNEPCYIWGNSVNVRIVAAALFIRTNDHYKGVALSGYTPFTYPHYLVTGSIAPSDIPFVPPYKATLMRR